jgi:hypothetical protein
MNPRVACEVNRKKDWGVEKSRRIGGPVTVPKARAHSRRNGQNSGPSMSNGRQGADL